MSDSGDANGKHLHFEVFKDNQKINPTKYINSDFIDTNNQVNLKYSVGETVKINGVYVSSTSNQLLTPLITEGKITKIVKDSRNPYLLDDGKIGWVNDQNIVSNITQTYLSNKSYKGFSIVDALNQIKVDSTYNNRSRLAKLNGIKNYTGTATQNTNLLNLLKQGKLKNN